MLLSKHVPYSGKFRGGFIFAMFEVEVHARKLNSSNLTPCTTMSHVLQTCVATCAVLFEWFSQDVYNSSSVHATDVMTAPPVQRNVVDILSPGVLENLTPKKSLPVQRQHKTSKYFPLENFPLYSTLL